MKARPNSGVLAWLAEVDEDTLFISVVRASSQNLFVLNQPRAAACFWKMASRNAAS